MRANKLRTFLSLLGITIGIFCIVAVLTVLNSMQSNIRKEVATLGSDVLYINRWPWTQPDNGEYKWWEYWSRPSMTIREVREVERDVPSASLATLCLQTRDVTVSHFDEELGGIRAYAVLRNFDKIQNIEIGKGRYLSASELDGGTPMVVLGYNVYESLFPGNADPLGKSVTMMNRRLVVVGVMKKVGDNIAGFDFDDGVVFPYNNAATFLDVSSLSFDPVLLVKAANGVNVEDLKYEVEGALRKVRKVRPGETSDFSINQLSQVSKQLDMMFGAINLIGNVIGGFSLIVGAFGIANIMFVTVKERTKVIGLKKAIGARSAMILTEFLIEAIVLCVIGGLIGIFIVWLLSLLMTYGLDFAVSLTLKNIIVGISVSAIVGTLAGIIPAFRASRLDPVVAIRTT